MRCRSVSFAVRTFVWRVSLSGTRWERDSISLPEQIILTFRLESMWGSSSIACCQPLREIVTATSWPALFCNDYLIVVEYCSDLCWMNYPQPNAKQRGVGCCKTAICSFIGNNNILPIVIVSLKRSALRVITLRAFFVYRTKQTRPTSRNEAPSRAGDRPSCSWRLSGFSDGGGLVASADSADEVGPELCRTGATQTRHFRHTASVNNSWLSRRGGEWRGCGARRAVFGCASCSPLSRRIGRRNEKLRQVAVDVLDEVERRTESVSSIYDLVNEPRTKKGVSPPNAGHVFWLVSDSEQSVNWDHCNAPGPGSETGAVIHPWLRRSTPPL